MPPPFLENELPSSTRSYELTDADAFPTDEPAGVGAYLFRLLENAASPEEHREFCAALLENKSDLTPGQYRRAVEAVRRGYESKGKGPPKKSHRDSILAWRFRHRKVERGFIGMTRAEIIADIAATYGATEQAARKMYDKALRKHRKSKEEFEKNDSGN